MAQQCNAGRMGSSAVWGVLLDCVVVASVPVYGRDNEQRHVAPRVYLIGRAPYEICDGGSKLLTALKTLGRQLSTFFNMQDRIYAKSDDLPRTSVRNFGGSNFFVRNVLWCRLKKLLQTILPNVQVELHLRKIAF